MTQHSASNSAPRSSQLAPRKTKTPWGKVGAVIGLSVYTVFALFPLYWILLMSLKVPQDVIASPPKFIFSATLDNYRNVLSRPDFLEPFKNSLIITLGALLLSLLIGLPAAYALARMQFRSKEDFAFSFLSMRFAPELLVILPLFVIYRQLHLYNTYWGLILVYQLIPFPLMVWMMRFFLEDVPREIEEAVTIDGGTWFTSFKMIAFRIALPGLAASVVLTFIYAWNNFVFGLILGGSDTQTITTGILQFISFQEVQWGPMAAAILSIIPEFMIASFALRYMIRGLTAGIVK